MDFIQLASINIYFQLNHFNGVFLDSFVTGGDYAISSPLAVKNQFIAPRYAINTREQIDCSAKNVKELNKISLVHDAENLVQLVTSCSNAQSKYTGPGSFKNIVEPLSRFQNALHSMDTTLKIDSKDGLTKVGERSHPGYDKIQFAPCSQQKCTPKSASDSSPEGVLFNTRLWTGPTKGLYPEDSIIVFSVIIIFKFDKKRKECSY